MRVLMPRTFEEALALKAREPGAVPIAGGTDVLVSWPERIETRDRTYLDLSALDELRPHALGRDELVLGALTTYWDILSDDAVGCAFPLLHTAAPQVGALQIQTRGTWAGNVANASPAADGVPVLMAYDAVIEVASAERGARTIPLAEFYHGYKQLEAKPDELIRAIRLPRRAHTVEIFEKVGPRRAQSIAKVGVAIARSAEAGWRVVATSVAPTVCRCTHVEALLERAEPSRGADVLLAAIDADVAPIDDLRSTAEYRRRVLSRLIWSSLRAACPWFG